MKHGRRSGNRKRKQLQADLRKWTAVPSLLLAQKYIHYQHYMYMVLFIMSIELKGSIKHINEKVFSTQNEELSTK